MDVNWDEIARNADKQTPQGILNEFLDEADDWRTLVVIGVTRNNDVGRDEWKFRAAGSTLETLGLLEWVAFKIKMGAAQ